MRQYICQNYWGDVKMRDENVVILLFVAGFYTMIPFAIIYALTNCILFGLLLLASGMMVVISIIWGLIIGLKKYRIQEVYGECAM